MLKNLQKKRDEGFTIIEVLIVLAIAGLIMLVVFLAVPALNRNSHNTQRKNDAAGIMGALQETINNSNGTAPSGTTTPGAIGAVKLTNLSTVNYNVVASGTSTVPATIDKDTIFVRNGLKCSGTVTADATAPSTTNVTTTTGATLRSFIVLYSVESSSGFSSSCQEV